MHSMTSEQEECVHAELLIEQAVIMLVLLGAVGRDHHDEDRFQVGPEF